MYTRRFLIGVLMMALHSLVGCNGSSLWWYQPGKTLGEVKRDCRDCRHQAQAEAFEYSWSDIQDGLIAHGLIFPYTSWRMHKDIEFKRCMKHRGYRHVRKDTLGPAVRRRAYDVAGELYCIAANTRSFD
jgi:hypothetical protein